MQENVLKQQADPENGSDSDHSSDSSNSSSSSFGCQSQDEEEKPRKKKKKKQPAKAKAAPKDMAKPKAQPRKTEKAKDRLEKEKSNKALAKEASILDGAAKLLTLLGELTCPAIWRSTVRSTEVDRRIGRATPTCSEIENVLTEIQGEDVEARKGKLLEIRNRLNKELKDLCKIIRNSSAEELIEEVSAAGTIKHHFEACWASVFDADGTLAEMVRMISKNIADVSWLVAGHETMD